MANNRWQNEVRVIKRALTDAKYLQALIQNPTDTIESTLGISLDGDKVHILREDTGVLHLVFPKAETPLGTLEITPELEQKTEQGYVRKLLEARAFQEALEKGQSSFHLSPERLTEVVRNTLDLQDAPEFFRVQLHHETDRDMYLAIPYWVSNAYQYYTEEG
ncbi:MAG: hypothetical protein AAFQ98_07910 [Bacteroidota bacterium]